MNILLINVPSRKGKGGLVLPLGLLYAGGIIKRTGHSAKIYDPYICDGVFEDWGNNDFSDIERIIKESNPSIIGLGGIATSYGFAKKLSRRLHEVYPKITQIAGGPLASVDDLLLKETAVKYVFHGETEVSLPEFIKSFESSGRNPENIKGIAYIREGMVIRNPLYDQITELDRIPLPAYDLVDIKQYTHSIEDWVNTYKLINSENPRFIEILAKLGKKKFYLPLVTSRGCTHKCLFCYRHVLGIRQHSVAYIVEHMKYLIKNYGIEGFQFADELFNSNRDWVMELCRKIKEEKLDIFYLVAGARIDKIDREMLERLYETGCVEINYGHESGSEKILKEYRKGVTAKQNLDITLLTKEVGINCPVQIVIGSPSETPDTIKETIKFLKAAGAYQFSLNYILPLPKTPIWRYVQENSIIPDVEKYLDEVAARGGAAIVNLTKVSDSLWRKWGWKINWEMKLAYYLKRKEMFFYLFYSFLFVVMNIIPPRSIRKIIPGFLQERLRRI